MCFDEKAGADSGRSSLAEEKRTRSASAPPSLMGSEC